MKKIIACRRENVNISPFPAHLNNSKKRAKFEALVFIPRAGAGVEKGLLDILSVLR